MPAPAPDSPPALLLDARNLSRRFGPHLAVAGVSVRLARGEILGLLGPNGAGKSTTLRMLTGAVAPDTGTVAVLGHDMGEDPAAARAGLGYLPDVPPLYAELTVAEYLAYAARLHRLAGAAVQPAVQRALADCGLNAVAGRLVGNLSKGYQQRVGIAQAIVHRPPVVILDEPTVGLDPLQILEIRALVRSLAEHHSVILSSHILAEVQAVCTRVMILARGRVVYDGGLDPDAASAAPAVWIGLARPPQDVAARVAALPGVAGAELGPDGRVRARLAPDTGVPEATEARERLVRALVETGWGLTEFRPDRRTLEDLFVRVTGGETTAEPSPESLPGPAPARPAAPAPHAP